MNTVSFVDKHEKEISTLVNAGIEREQEKVIAAAAALFVKCTTGSSIAASAAETAAKAFGNWLFENGTTRLQQAAAEYQSEDEQKRERQEFASWLQLQLTQAIKSTNMVIKNVPSADRSEAVYYELFGQVLRQQTEQKVVNEELLESTQRIERVIEEIRINITKRKISDSHFPSPVLNLEDEIEVYCSKTKSLHATLPIAGFKTKLRVPLDLAELHVPLDAIVDLRAVGQACFSDANDAETKLREHAGAHEIKLIEAFREVNKRNRQGLVILGDPGSGKTTHLKRLLLYCLQEGPESFGLSKEMLPVFLPLRELESLNQGLDGFIEDQLESPHHGMEPGFGKRLRERGDLLFLLDGLDEVVDPKRRKEVSQWIKKALPEYPSCCFVVTCRFAGYTPNVQLGVKFLELHIRPMTAEQASQFVHNWYRIVETGLSEDHEQGEVTAKERADSLVSRLNEQDFRARRVFELTRNPLLLANICLVHRDRGQLPKRRADLYEECIEVLLERWRESKGLHGINAEIGCRILQPAAYFLHSAEGRIRATEQELLDVIDPVLRDVKYQGGDGSDFLRTVRDDSGLLTGWGNDSYGFMHLGFQEYLAANHILHICLSKRDDTLLYELASHFGESWWQEVTLILLALKNFPFESFMRELLKREEIVNHQDLLDLCLDDALEVSGKPFVELVQQSTKRLFWFRRKKDRSLWSRQLLALKMLEILKYSQMDELKRSLADHPSMEIQSWLKGQQVKTEQAIVTAPRGGCELIWIPGGKYQMGSPETEEGRQEREGPVHPVELKPFYMGRYPVTNEEYDRFLSSNPGVKEPGYWGNREYNQPRQPVVGVTWHDAQRYAEWAGLRLPSEAEWEYACRAGTSTRFYSGDSDADLDRVGWYSGNSKDQLHPVGEKEPNAFGLFDMHGNVWEWVEDDFHGNYNGAPSDGSAWVDNPRSGGHVLRGGAWDGNPHVCRSAVRYRFNPDYGYLDGGFRVVLDKK